MKKDKFTSINYLKRSVRLTALIIFLYSLSYLSCSQESSTNSNEISKSELSKIFNDSLNLVFLTTDWCPVSNDILKNTYKKLCDSLSSKVNIVLICASESDSSFSKYLSKLGIACPFYLLPNKKSHEKLLEHEDRKRIRHFIKNNLKGYNKLSLDWQFGIPVSLFVNKKLEVIREAPQQYEDIRKEVLGEQK